jgi:hypothetical protein
VGAAPATREDDVTDLTTWLPRAVEAVARWEESFGSFPRHPSLHVDDERLADAFDALSARLTDNYPFFHPHYVGQMLKPPHPAAVLGYVTAMLINPNNHALDGGPATAAMEKDVVARLATMFGMPRHLGHLTSSGTIANLEALFVARECHPGKAVAFSADAHYTHARMCHVLGVEAVSIPTDELGRMDLDALDAELSAGRIGTVVATLGTTGLGAVDPLDRIVPLAREHGVRVHVDTAYGGFFSLIADGTEDGVVREPFEAIRQADSVVVDPHKHGLQPYGCGAVLFADPSVGRFYGHDSPYTYFSSDELHLGEISLECSRAGASAAALWLTLEVLPLTADGLRCGAAARPPRRTRVAPATPRLPCPAPLPAAGARHRHVPPRSRDDDRGGRGKPVRVPGGRAGRPARSGARRDLRGHRWAPGRARARDRARRRSRTDPAQRRDEAGERGRHPLGARPTGGARQPGLAGGWDAREPHPVG